VNLLRNNSIRARFSVCRAFRTAKSGQICIQYSHVAHLGEHRVPSWLRKEAQPVDASSNETGLESSVRFLLLHSLHATNTLPGT
jgi:hypothetical protein